MATKVDELVIQIRAETKDLEKKLGNINRQIGGVGGAGRRGFGGLSVAVAKVKAPLLAAAAGLVAVGASVVKIAKVGAEFEELRSSLDVVFGSMKGGQNAMDRIVKFAQTTPFQIEDVSKAFIQLKAAGIEPSANQLQIFADTASVAVDSLGAFEALVRITQRSAGGGLGLEELEQLSDRGIPVYSILMEKMKVSRQQLSEIGQTAAGAKLIMDTLTEGMEEAFGGAMAGKMDILNTKVSNMNIAFKRVGDAIYKSIQDPLKGVVDWLARIANDSADLITSLQTGVPSDVLKMDTTKARIEGSGKEIERLRKDIEDLAALQLLKDVGINIENIKKFEESFAKLKLDRKSAGLFTPNVLGGNAYLATLTEVRGILTKIAVLEKYITDQKDLQATSEQAKVDAAKAAAKAAADALTAEQKAILDPALKEALDLAKPAQKYIDILEMMTNATEELRDLYSDKEWETLEKHFERLRDEASETADTFAETMAPAIAQMAHSFTNEFVNALLSGKDALESFKNFAQNIVSQIISTFIQMFVVNKILDMVFSGMPGWTPLSPASTGAGPSGNKPIVPGAQALATLGGNAGGGRMMGGTPYLVGERGPELFITNTGGTLKNAADTRGMSGGSTIVVNQSLNFALGVQSTVRAEVTSMLPQIVDASKAGIAETIRRGGNQGAALAG